MNVSLLGLGRWGKVLAGAITRAGWNIVATFDPREPSATHVSALAATHDPSAEAVVIATPPDTHYDLARLALLAGKHVLCEKPLAFSAAACLDLEAIAAETRRVLMVDYLPLFLDEVQALPSGAWRDATCCVFLRYAEQRPFHNVGPLWDLTVHDLALASHLLGELPGSGWQATADSLRVATPGDGPLVTLHAGYGRSWRSAMALWRDGRATALTQQQTSPEPLQAVLREFQRIIAGEVANRADACLSAAIARILH